MTAGLYLGIALVLVGLFLAAAAFGLWREHR